jgi:hypothetical protein
MGTVSSMRVRFPCPQKLDAKSKKDVTKARKTCKVGESQCSSTRSPRSLVIQCDREIVELTMSYRSPLSRKKKQQIQCTMPILDAKKHFRPKHATTCSMQQSRPHILRARVKTQNTKKAATL